MDNFFHILLVKFIVKEREKTLRRKYEKTNIAIFSIFITGVIIGSVFANNLDRSIDSSAAEVSQLVSGFIINTNINEFSSLYLFGRSFLTYSKHLVLIWLLGLFKLAAPLIGLLVGILGFSYGFTTSFFIMEYSLKGLSLCLATYGFQGTIFVFINFILSIEALRFVRKDRAVSSKIYLLYLLASIFGVFMIALYEAYIAPIIIQDMLRSFFY